MNGKYNKVVNRLNDIIAKSFGEDYQDAFNLQVTPHWSRIYFNDAYLWGTWNNKEEPEEAYKSVVERFFDYVDRVSIIKKGIETRAWEWDTQT